MTDVHDAKNASLKRRRAKRSLTAEEKLQIWLELLSGESSQRDAAQRWGVDPTTIMRIRRVAREARRTGWAEADADEFGYTEHDTSEFRAV